MDACFRLKRHAFSNEIRDPALGDGWAYMVEWGPYKEYLLQVGDQQEISTCTGFKRLLLIMPIPSSPGGIAQPESAWGFAPGTNSYSPQALATYKQENATVTWTISLAR
ncbi:CxC2 domain-containing protein [Mycena indigotica]|uniref:CxC2 domain-containing protein n=1 Tax=Mycena indigotica TaxID=2126181 RepID=A0A8H6W483_9AGAR|nr:CxC2 domain-containing protein [Mycena indigotica]KAF7301158.1 CxC2 domain-containing protein [Mycena indigotica]